MFFQRDIFHKFKLEITGEATFSYELLTPAQVHTSISRQAKSYIHQVFADTCII